MKIKLDKHHNRVRVFEPGDGIRRRYYDAISPGRFTHPRKTRLNHSMSWYCDGHITRPLIGIYSCGKLAEHLMYEYRTKDGGTGRRYLAAVSYYASTRRAMEQVIRHYPIDGRLSGRSLESVRKIYLRLCSEGMKTVEATHLTPMTEI